MMVWQLDWQVEPWLELELELELKLVVVEVEEVEEVVAEPFQPLGYSRSDLWPTPATLW